ncbi:response regulator [Omnitrophica bacterium]|nr:response regulator [Candidatus Omnitrophota bacterium]
MPKKILIADDDPDLRAILSHYLTKEGYEVLAASNGEEACEVAIREKPDFMVLDIVMPGQDGIDARIALRENPVTHDIPAVFLTSLKTQAEENSPFQERREAVMAKPVDLPMLLRRIQQATSH